ncbi:MAG: aminotransferase class I/II-fold pyridoxal phosphate-dependent enzyme [Clostridia bacterium]
MSGSPVSRGEAERKAVFVRWGAEPDVSVILGNGSAEIFYKAMTWSSIMDVVISVPTFNEYARAASFAGKPCAAATTLKEEEEFRPNLSALLPYIKNGTLCLLCNPNNPTGQLLLGSELRPFLDELQRKGAYLMVDECFIEFSRQSLAQSMVEAVPSHPNLMVVRAATKFSVCQDCDWDMALHPIRLGLKSWRRRWSRGTSTRQQLWHRAVFFKTCLYMEKTRRWFETERPTFCPVFFSGTASMCIPDMPASSCFAQWTRLGQRTSTQNFCRREF